ncbi:unnamed protein product [Rotaria sp. Silwood2]|nr:unnamed protein product [Rotaria sp. Silwood2]
MDVERFGDMRSALSNMIQGLGSGYVRIGILFYGSLSTVDVVHSPSNNKESIHRIKAKIEQKQFRTDSEQNPSTIYDALREVESMCNRSCRNIFIPRVTVVITSASQPNPRKTDTLLLGATLRMTIIAIGVGSHVDRTTLSLIASEPFTYTASYHSFSALIIGTQYINSLTSSVPAVLQYEDLPLAKYYDENDLDWYNTVQYVVTNPKDHIVVLSFETDACCSRDSPIKVYASKIDPMPTNDNAGETRSYTSEKCGDVNRFKYYFLMREQYKRLYVSFMVTGKAQTVKYQTSIIDYNTMTSGTLLMKIKILIVAFRMKQDQKLNSFPVLKTL